MVRARWVLLAYRFPSEPSTPRITLWRRLRRLGVAQVADGVVGLPLDARTREQLERLADGVTEHGGEAAIWIAEPAAAAQERALAAGMQAAVAADYARLVRAAQSALAEPAGARRRRVAVLRRELHRIADRDYFPAIATERARRAVEALADSLEAVP